MITDETLERVRGWFTGRLPEEWRVEAPTITVDRDEIVVVLHLPDIETGPEATDAEIAETWRAAMWAKPAAHGMDQAGLDSADYVQPERSMSAIGG